MALVCVDLGVEILGQRKRMLVSVLTRSLGDLGTR